MASVEREHRRDIVVASRESGGDLRLNKGGGIEVLWIDLRKRVAGKRARAREGEDETERVNKERWRV